MSNGFCSSLTERCRASRTLALAGLGSAKPPPRRHLPRANLHGTPCGKIKSVAMALDGHGPTMAGRSSLYAIAPFAASLPRVAEPSRAVQDRRGGAAEGRCAAEDVRSQPGSSARTRADRPARHQAGKASK